MDEKPAPEQEQALGKLGVVKSPKINRKKKHKKKKKKHKNLQVETIVNHTGLYELAQQKFEPFPEITSPTGPILKVEDIVTPTFKRIDDYSFKNVISPLSPDIEDKSPKTPHFKINDDDSDFQYDSDEPYIDFHIPLEFSERKKAFEVMNQPVDKKKALKSKKIDKSEKGPKEVTRESYKRQNAPYLGLIEGNYEEMAEDYKKFLEDIKAKENREDPKLRILNFKDPEVSNYSFLSDAVEVEENDKNDDDYEFHDEEDEEYSYESLRATSPSKKKPTVSAEERRKLRRKETTEKRKFVKKAELNMKKGDKYKVFKSDKNTLKITLRKMGKIKRI